ncbi:type I methionyl aminopeptidase [Acetobacter sp.]|uniref:type I methionyl aminopeptidase n=1 Tax=Acetobacter sp. TaxID=440 RepID=UPI0039E95C97
MEGKSVRHGVILHSEADFVGLRAAGRLAAETLDMITEYVRPGVTTGELDTIIHEFTLKNNATPATLGYKGYPKSCCISINHVVCHGIPGERVLQDGDILNIDVTSIVDGWYGDSSRMYVAGKPSVKAKKLIEVTYDCMMAGIEQVRPGATLGDIGHAIQTLAEKNRFSVVRDFCGHGIGRTFHSEPHILHYGRPGEGMKLEAGMVFTIEPMINIGRPEVKILDDGWTAVTRDRSLTAQFEHMLGVTETGYEIFTLSPKGYTRPPYGA